jgi:hypothetical protein
MKSMLRLLLVLGVVVTTGLVIGIFLRPSAPDDERWTPVVHSTPAGQRDRIHTQHRSARIFIPVTMAPRCTLDAANATPVLSPVDVRTDAAGNVFVLDWADKSIKKYSPAGTYIRSFGYGEGQGPGEFSNPTDFDVDDDGRVWVCDPVAGMIHRFDVDGALLGSLRPAFPPYRIALLDRGYFALMASPIGEHLLALLAPDGKILRRMGTIIDRQEMMGIALDGKLCGSSEGRLAYAGYRAGVIGVFDRGQDSLPLFSYTLQHPGIPSVLTRVAGETRYTRVDPESPLASRSVSLVRGDAHVLIGSDGERDRGLFDVYDQRTGKYRFSYEMPMDAFAAWVTEDRTYALTDTSVVVWDRFPPSFLEEP